LADFYPEAKWQRCVVHFYRNVFTVVPKTKVKEVAAMLKAIHAQEDRSAAEEKIRAVIKKLRKVRLSKAANIVEKGAEETLRYYDFPSQHWRSLRTNNPLERLMREIRRRTRVVGAFPDGQSAIMLVAARLRHVAGTKWGTRRYLNMARQKRRQKRSHSGWRAPGTISLGMKREPKPSDVWLTKKKCEKLWTQPRNKTRY
jgi:transposase-like protein